MCIRDSAKVLRTATVGNRDTTFNVHHGSVVIAAITSCTNTSNPSVLVAAGLVAKRAVELGLSAKPWVKTSLAPGSRVVMDYLERADLVKPLDALGFYLAGYGCTTCIGNTLSLIHILVSVCHGPLSSLTIDALTSMISPVRWASQPASFTLLR